METVVTRNKIFDTYLTKNKKDKRLRTATRVTAYSLSFVSITKRSFCSLNHLLNRWRLARKSIPLMGTAAYLCKLLCA